MINIRAGGRIATGPEPFTTTLEHTVMDDDVTRAHRAIPASLDAAFRAEPRTARQPAVGQHSYPIRNARGQDLREAEDIEAAAVRRRAEQRRRHQRRMELYAEAQSVGWVALVWLVCVLLALGGVIGYGLVMGWWTAHR